LKESKGGNVLEEQQPDALIPTLASIHFEYVFGLGAHFFEKHTKAVAPDPCVTKDVVSKAL
jgi:hypothetical protein